jgi:Flp pilus assembly protein CpaB
MSTQPRSESPFQNRTLMMVALILGVAAFVLNFFYVSRVQNEMRRGAFNVARASVDLESGARVDPSDVSFVEVPGAFDDALRDLVVREDEMGGVVGNALMRPVARGQILLWEYFGGRQGFNPQDVIDARYRAVTIQVDSTATPLALLQPGGYVDLVATVRLPDGAGPRTLTVMEHVQVLATGTELLPDNPDEERRRPTRRRTFRDITLQLRPEDAVRLRAVEQYMERRQFIVHARNPNDTSRRLPEGRFNPALDPILSGVGEEGLP